MLSLRAVLHHSVDHPLNYHVWHQKIIVYGLTSGIYPGRGSLFPFPVNSIWCIGQFTKRTHRHIFFKMSDRLTFVRTLMGFRIPSVALSHNFFYVIAACLFFNSESHLVLDIIIPKLSPQSDIGTFTGTPKYLNIYCMKIASYVATR